MKSVPGPCLPSPVDNILPRECEGDLWLRQSPGFEVKCSHSSPTQQTVPSIAKIVKMAFDNVGYLTMISSIEQSFTH